MKYVAHKAEETADIARVIVAEILKRGTPTRSSAAVIALFGDMGSGKTSFTQAIAKELGIKEAVPSPTFVIERIYEIKKPPFARLVHIDAYRLRSDSELKQIGWNEIERDERNIVVVEWADKVKALIPKDAIKIYFRASDKHENTRHINIVYSHVKRKT